MGRSYSTWVCALTVLASGGCDEGVQAMGGETAVGRDGPVHDRSETCEVIVAGGSTAALAAAMTSAREGARTCLVEPTDWLGGQITTGGVPAIDFAWHSVDTLRVGDIAKNPANLPPEFVAWMDDEGNPGNCWVSKNCFRPDRFATRLAQTVATEPALRDNLVVLTRAVVKHVDVTRTGSAKSIERVVVVQRTPRDPADEWSTFLSADLPDWYDVEDSDRFTKEVIELRGRPEQRPVVIDATEFGDVLVLADAPYMQGVEVVDGTTDATSDTCGQAFVFPFVMHYETGPRSQPPNPFPVEHPSFYSQGTHTWDQIWRYRRIFDHEHAGGHYGDRSLQNWYPGNDYGFGYLLLDRQATSAQRDDWMGGLDLDSLAGAEAHAYGWFHWLRAREPNGRASHITLDDEMLGTEHGLSKLPYVRDTRRSVGLNDFVLAARHFYGDAADLTGTRFADRIAIGSYAVDIHGLSTCSMPGYIHAASHYTLPFYVPFRALTNRDVDNLLVAGKTMAQSFLTNAATRLQPIEWSTGIGAGAAAAHMSTRGISTSRGALEDIDAIQARIRLYAPTEWTIDGVTYPRPDEVLPPVPSRIHCPEGTHFDEGYGYCVNERDAYGPFSHSMTERCVQFGGGPACTNTQPVEVAGRQLALQRWSKSFALAIRGDGPCPRGATRDPQFLGHCAERYWDGERWIHDVFGPFGADLVERCEGAGGGNACYTHRWSAPFFLSLLD